MLNFTVGPVQMDQAILRCGSEQIPYFRTDEFSQTMFDNERMILSLLQAPPQSRATFLTGSGTASMEAVVMSVLNQDDRALVIDGGTFGHRFQQLCEIHMIQNTTISLAQGHALTPEHLAVHEGAGYSSLLVNIHETSTGVLYDLDLIADFCRRNEMLLVVDAISSFLADPLNMANAGIDVVILGSQKALACPPGVSIVALSPRAQERVLNSHRRSMYLDLRAALDNGVRGQTPFTPAVGVLLQLNCRLHDITSKGGVITEIGRTARLAADFRRRIASLPLEITSERLSNALTPIRPTSVNATTLFQKLKDNYGIWVTPSGGGLATTLLRVGHIGNLQTQDNEKLVDALSDILCGDLA